MMVIRIIMMIIRILMIVINGVVGFCVDFIEFIYLIIYLFDLIIKIMILMGLLL